MAMSQEAQLLILFGGLAVILLIADRYYRIGPYVYGGIEGFFGGGNAQRCGVDMPPCPHPLKCGNGYCMSQREAAVVDRYTIPVLP